MKTQTDSNPKCKDLITSRLEERLNDIKTRGDEFLGEEENTRESLLENVLCVDKTRTAILYAGG